MKKPSSKIREEILKLQEQLKTAETREAERIGRVALKAGLGNVETSEEELQAAFEEIARRFRNRAERTIARKSVDAGEPGLVSSPTSATIEAGTTANDAGEA